MILSRSKPLISENVQEGNSVRSGNQKLTKYEEYLDKRDYIGAITVLEFKELEQEDPHIRQWVAYCAFHIGDYKKALDIYRELITNQDRSKDLDVNLACCYFYMGMYKESEETLQKAPISSLKIRLNFHLAHKLGDDNALVEYHQQLQDVLEDQLTLAAIHYLRAHYQEAIDIYKKLLLQNRNNLALNVYIALCYYKLDYYDLSQELLTLYLSEHPDSVVATNLKACNQFRLYNGMAAENEIKSIVNQSANIGFGRDLVKHNLVVFRGGEEALQVFPSLVNVVPEARLNLVIYYLKNEDYKKAYDLSSDLQPTVPQEYILKGIVNAALGQELNSNEHLKIAEECFHLVGSSTSECDTIHGRQCMAALSFLAGHFDDVLLYLSSIKSFLHADDTFNFNFAQAKAACHDYKEAEMTFLLITDANIIDDPIYVSHLARCYIFNRKAQLAWELYLKSENSMGSFNLLLLIANDCYRVGEFWYAAKAFDTLNKLEPNPEFWEGKRGAIAGVFQGVLAQKYPIDLLGDVLQLLRNSTSLQADHIAKVIRHWTKENRVLQT